MKNKKGFTLTELIGVIVILGIIMTLGVVAYTEIRKNILEKQYNNLISYIETKAASYADNTGELTVTVERLLETGYLEGEKEQKIIDPRDQSSMNCLLFDSKYENGYYISKLDGKIEEENGICSKYNVKKDIQICVLNGSECLTSIENWYNKNVTLKVLIGGNEAPETAKISWRANGEVKEQLEYTTQVSLINKGEYTADVKYETINADGTKKIFEGSDTVPINIDKEKPVVTKIEVEKKDVWENTDKRVAIAFSDNNGSGIGEVAFFNKNTGKTCLSNDLTWEVNPTGEYITKQDNGEYKVCVKDIAGNISEELTNPIKVEYIDKVDPTCNYEITGEKLSTTSEWYTNNITLGINASDNDSGILAYGITDNSSKYYNMKSEVEHKTNTDNSGQEYHFWVKDKAGNESTCYTNVKLDKTDPQCSIGVTGTKTISTSNWYTSNVTLTLNETKGASNIIGHSIGESTVATYNYNNDVQKLEKGTAENLTVNGYVLAQSGRTGDCKLEHLYVDSTKPGIGNITKTPANGDNGVVTIATTLTDNGSKLAAYAITSSSSAPTSWTSISGTPNSKDITSSISASGTYYVWAKDIAGNTDSKSVDVVVTYVQKTRVRYENVNGTWTDYTVVDTKKVNYGSSYSWSTSQITNFDSTTYKSNSVASYTVTGEKTNDISIYRNTFTCKIGYRYQNADGTYGSTTNAVNTTLRYGQTCSWSRSADTTYQVASYSNTITSNIDTTVNVNRNTYTCTKQYRLENLDGSWSSYTSDGSTTALYGGSCSYSKSVTNYKGSSSGSNGSAGSASASNVTSNQTLSISFYRNTYTCSKQYQLENVDGSWGSYTSDGSTTVKYGGSCSYSKSVTNYRGSSSGSNGSAGSASASNVTSNQTLSISFYRNVFTCSKQYRLENADGSWGSYTSDGSVTARYGGSCSYSKSVTNYRGSSSASNSASGSASASNVTSNQTLSISFYRNVFNCSKQYRLENLNGSWSTYTSDGSVTARYGGSCSYSKSVTNYRGSSSAANNTAGSASASNITSAQTLSISLYLNKYTVSFNSDGGSGVSSQTITHGGTASKPSNPSRSGYSFVNWYLNGSVYNFSSAVTSNITLTASWQQTGKSPLVVNGNVIYYKYGGILRKITYNNNRYNYNSSVFKICQTYNNYCSETEYSNVSMDADSPLVVNGNTIYYKYGAY